MPYESLSRPLDLRGCPFMNSNQKREYQNQWERLQEIEDVVALKPRIINFLDDIDKHCGGYVEDRQKIILFVNAHFKELYKKQIAFLTSEIERSSMYQFNFKGLYANMFTDLLRRRAFRSSSQSRMPCFVVQNFELGMCNWQFHWKAFSLSTLDSAFLVYAR